MSSKHRAVVARIGDEKNHATDTEVTLLDAHAPLERLKIVESRLGLDDRVHQWAIDDDVGASKVAGQRDGDLGAPPKSPGDSLSQPFDEREMGRVTDWRSRRKEAHPQVEPKGDCHDGDPIQGHPL